MTKSNRTILLIILKIFIGIGLAGCTGENSLNPEISTNPVKDINIVALRDVCTSVNKFVAEQKYIIRENGRELIFHRKKTASEVKATFKIPPSRDTLVKMELNDNYLDFIFMPHCLQFSRAALLNIEAKNVNLDGVNPSALGLYYQTKSGDWEEVETYGIIVQEDESCIKIIDAEIPHLARYAVAWAK